MSRGSSTTHSTRGVAPIVGAQVAHRALRDVEALLAERHPVLRLGDGAGQPERVDLLDLQQVERDPLGGLRSDPGEATELVDQLLHRLGVDRHQLGAEDVAEPGERAHRLALDLEQLRVHVVQRGHHEVLEHGDVVRVDDLADRS